MTGKLRYSPASLAFPFTPVPIPGKATQEAMIPIDIVTEHWVTGTQPWH
jgi:hypothetical protein